MFVDFKLTLLEHSEAFRAIYNLSASGGIKQPFDPLPICRQPFGVSRVCLLPQFSNPGYATGWDQLFANTNVNSKYWKKVGTLSSRKKKNSALCDPKLPTKKICCPLSLSHSTTGTHVFFFFFRHFLAPNLTIFTFRDIQQLFLFSSKNSAE